MFVVVAIGDEQGVKSILFAPERFQPHDHCARTTGIITLATGSSESGDTTMSAAFIVAGKRTPFGAFGGSLKKFTAPELGAVAAAAAIKQTGKPADIVDSVVIGNVQQSTTDCSYMARHVGLKAGVPIEKPMLTVNRLCGSGFQAIVTAAQEIKLGESHVVLAGGAESMSQSPYLLHGTRWGMPLGKNHTLVDSLWEGLTDRHCGLPMSMTAENVAKQFGVSREDSDEFAVMSQHRYFVAKGKGVFEKEIVPMEELSADECPRETSLEKVKTLRTIFKDGVVTAGNASAITDGAAASLVASEEALTKHGLTPLARIVSYAVVGVDPTIMGIGPVQAYKLALEKAGLSLDDMDLCEINEAFSCQFLACVRELGLDLEKTNQHGGAIAIGHPTGASGTRIMNHLTYQLHDQNKKYAIGGACIGGGQGIAMIIERV